MDYTTIALIIMFFCFGVSGFLTFLYFKSEENIRARYGFAAYGMFILGFIALYSVVGISMESLTQGPCEWLVANSTDVSPTTRAYEYNYSCTDRTSFQWVETIYIIFTWLVYAFFISTILVPIIYLIKLWKGKL